MKYDSPPKLDLRAMKPVVSSFYLKIKNLIGMVGVTEPLSSMLPCSNYSRKCLKKKNHYIIAFVIVKKFIVIFSFELQRLLKVIQSVPEVNHPISETHPNSGKW